MKKTFWWGVAFWLLLFLLIVAYCNRHQLPPDAPPGIEDVQ